MATRCFPQKIDQITAGVILGLGAETVADEALKRPNGDGTIQLASTTGRLARGPADAAAQGREGIGPTGDEVGALIVSLGDGADVTPGVRVHGTGRLTPGRVQQRRFRAP